MMNKQNASFGEVLRAVGQGLESLNVENFELQAEGDGYFVLGTPRSRSWSYWVLCSRSSSRHYKIDASSWAGPISTG